MRKEADYSLRRALFRFALLVLAALALQGIPLLYMLMEGDGGTVLYLVHLYGVIPLAAVLVPFWAGLGGVHPFAGFFPIGGAVLVFPVYQSPKIGFLCLGLSLVACVAGREWRARGKKERRHGGKTRKR